MEATLIPPLRADWALFLDVDGTLLEFVADPAAVRADARLLDTLRAASAALDGAVALVSGRPLDVLDAIFPGLGLPAAGLHGLERRSAHGRERVPSRVPADVLAALDGFAAARPGLRLEDKGATAALHYREAPRFAAEAETHVERLATRLGPAWQLQRGACVLELKPTARDKGHAVTAFMAEAPFAGRVPLYVGDDLTDLDGFAAAEALGGAAVAVGPRVAARWRLADPAATRAWLEALVGALGRRPAAIAAPTPAHGRHASGAA